MKTHDSGWSRPLEPSTSDIAAEVIQQSLISVAGPLADVEPTRFISRTVPNLGSFVKDAGNEGATSSNG